MTREQRLKFCNKCELRKLDFERGLVCSLTDEFADFEGTCSKFRDESLQHEAKSISQAKHNRAFEIDEARIREEYEKHEHLPYAIIGGSITAVIFAIIWGLVSYLAEFQIGIMAVLLGLGIGFSVRFYGSGTRPIFGVLGATLALLGCLMGNLFTQVGIMMDDSSLNYLQVFNALGVVDVLEIYTESFHVLDLLFYVIAMFEGYRFAFRPLPVKAYTSTDFSPKYSMMKAPLIAFKTCVFLAIFAFTSMDIGNHEQYHFADGSPEASGAWYGGLEHGKWIYFHENGEPYTVMNYYKGKEEGAVNQFYDTGELYATGTYTNGLEDGPWMFYDEMGQLFYSSNYSLGRETGEKIILHSNGQFLEHGDMNRDLQVGEWEYKYENGQTEKKGEFKDGIPHGVWTFYYPNGAISHETNAVSETKEKILTVYDTDGELLVDNGFGWCTLYDQYWYKLVEGQVENGDRVGEWTWYHSNGNKKVLGEYKNEEFRIISCWNSNGEQTVSGGDGNFSDIDVTSGLFEKGVYENGKRTGVWESFFPES
ncbi:MAG: toxin-antitoxin system YwqK family antitoxin, partial [Flavobacteriales bacterium]